MNVKNLEKLAVIAQIANGVKTYKTMYVTTEGQMFLNKEDAEEAVRVKNMIIDDQNELIGILQLTESVFTLDNLRMFGKEPKTFSARFKEASIPRNQAAKKEEPKKVAPSVGNVGDDINNALGLSKAVAGANGSSPAPQAESVEEKVTETANADVKTGNKKAKWQEQV